MINDELLEARRMLAEWYFKRFGQPSIWVRHILKNNGNSKKIDARTFLGLSKKTNTMNEEMDYEEWFPIFVTAVRATGYKEPIEFGTYEAEYSTGQTPEAAAQEFVKEITK